MGALRGEELVQCVFWAVSASCASCAGVECGHTMYRALFGAVVAHPFPRPVAPVAALDAACTRKVPASGGCIAPLRFGGRVGGMLSLAAHIGMFKGGKWMGSKWAVIGSR
jgi:hypothetical protein